MWFRHRRVAALLTALLLVAVSLVGTSTVAVADAAVPNAPTTLRFDPNPGTTNGPVTLKWNAPTNVTNVAYYQIFRFKGTGTPIADNFTYIDMVTEPTYSGTIPSDGTYQFAVMAVDSDGDASPLSAWVQIRANTPKGNDNAAPNTPTGLNLGGDYVKTRTVTLAWQARAADDLWRFLIFRQADGAERELAGYVPANQRSFTEELGADGSYVYSVMAQDATGNISAYSAGKRVGVDTVDPVVTITTPTAAGTYTGAALTASTTIVENGSGYAADAVKYYLNGEQISSTTINLNDLISGDHTLRVTVQDRAGNTGEASVAFRAGNSTANPAAPRALVLPAYSKTGAITLSWAAPQQSGVTGYAVHRTNGTQAATKVGPTLGASVRTFTETLTADGDYTYTVFALYGTAEAVSSAPAEITVDKTLPVITISSPANGTYTDADGAVEIIVDVADSNPDDNGVKRFLDGAAFTGTRINMANLRSGSHTLRVEVTDRAENKATASVTFTVNSTDDETDGPSRPVSSQELLDALKSFSDTEIAKGHRAALSAFARNGNLKAFRNHLEKFGYSRFISDSATEELLEILGDGFEVPGKGHGLFKKKGRGMR